MAARGSVPIAIDLRFRKTKRVAGSVDGLFGARDFRQEAETDFYLDGGLERGDRLGSGSPGFPISSISIDGVDQGRLNIPLRSEFFPSEVQRVGEKLPKLTLTQAEETGGKNGQGGEELLD